MRILTDAVDFGRYFIFVRDYEFDGWVGPDEEHIILSEISKDIYKNDKIMPVIPNKTPTLYYVLVRMDYDCGST